MRSIFDKLGLDRILGTERSPKGPADSASDDARRGARDGTPAEGFWARLLGASAADPRETATLRRIVAELEDLDPGDAHFVGAFAYVLARVARADLEFSPAEIRAMERALLEVAELPAERASLVVELARVQATLEGGTEDYRVTRQFRELAERSERLKLIRALFAVASADGSVSLVEDQTISQIGVELGLTAPEVAACRGEFREFLAVLQGLPQGSSEA